MVLEVWSTLPDVDHLCHITNLVYLLLCLSVPPSRPLCSASKLSSSGLCVRPTAKRMLQFCNIQSLYKVLGAGSSHCPAS